MPHGLLFLISSNGSFMCTSHRQDSTYYGLCYTSRGALVGTRNSSVGPPYEGSIRPIAPWANALTMELHLAPPVEEVTINLKPIRYIKRWITYNDGLLKLNNMKWIDEWMFNDTPAQKNKQISYWVSNKWYLNWKLNGKYGYIKNSYGYKYEMTHSTHFIYGYMTLDTQWEETCCQMGYSFQLAAMVLLYAPFNG